MSGLRLPSQMDDAELRNAGVLAHACELLLDLHSYGLIEGGPRVNAERCAVTIAAARERGLEWTTEEAENAAIALVEQWTAGSAPS